MLWHVTGSSEPGSELAVPHSLSQSAAPILESSTVSNSADIMTPVLTYCA
jgi:hypothetical protein